jgi:pimeloyl-ACP methyl ester carboxylesterase
MIDVYQSSRIVRVGEVDLNVTDHGPVDGAVVLMIHGFPDSARLWRHQIPALVEAGYRVIAPDLRGFGRSDRPTEVADCAMAVIVGDMLAILDDAGAAQAHVVGHDWGAAVAWSLAGMAPARVRTLTAISVGHPGAFAAAGLAQREKSWYMLLFQFEGVSEEWLSGNDWYWLRRWTRSDEIDHWIADLSRPGALTAAINIYRANMPPESLLKPPRTTPVEVPVLGVWSTDDIALTEKQMTGSEAFVSGEWRYERFEAVGHWIPLEAPERLNPLLLEWLGSH